MPASAPAPVLHIADNDNDIPVAWPATPLGRLARLAACGDISPAERDAGEIFHHIGSIAISDVSHSATVTFQWRYANGVWSTLFEQKRLVIERYEKAIESAGNDARRRALVASLVAREADFDIAWAGSIGDGLRNIARAWWGTAATATVKRNGVTLRAIRLIDGPTAADNDNSPTPERVAQAGEVVQTADTVRVRDNFERLFVRGQLDTDHEVAAALYAAGTRYQSDHQLAQLSGALGSPDYSRPVVDGSGEARTPISERAQAARSALRGARAAMGNRCSDVVDAVVLQGTTLEDAGLRSTGYRSTKMASAVAKERLNMGLRALAIGYGIAVHRRAA